MGNSGFQHKAVDQGGVTATFYREEGEREGGREGGDEGENPHNWSSISVLGFYKQSDLLVALFATI